jgi:hypothetical protein
MHLPDGVFETVFDFFAAEKPLARENEGIDKFKKSPPVFEFAGKPFHDDAIMSVSPDCANIRAHTAPGDNVNFDTILFENLNNANVSKPSGPTRRQCQTNAPMADFASKPTNISVKIPIRPAAQAQCRCGLWAAVNKPVNISPHLFEQIMEMLALLATDNRSQIQPAAAGMATNLS